jgi:predicted dehydrogenase
MANHVVRVGVIGVGNMGSGHVRMLTSGQCPEFLLTAICDLLPDRLENLKKEALENYQKRGIQQDISTFTDGIALLDSGLVDAVTVAVPHYDHPKFVIAALERGIHVLCEKPAGVYTKAVREMNAVAAAHPETTFALMFNQRTDSVYRKLKEIMDSKVLGEMKRVNWIITDWYRPQKYYDSGSWRATWSGEGGGVLLNQCPHQLDLWQWICGMPVRVEAHLHYGKWHDIEVEDDVTAYVEYANGATGVFITSTGDAPGTNRLEILCDGGKLICEGGKLICDKNELWESEFRNHAPRAFSDPPHHLETIATDGRSEQHVGVLNAFAAHILRGEPLIADGCEGIKGLTLSNAMHLSSWLGRTVELPLDEELFYQELMKRVQSSRRKVNIQEIVSDTTGSYGVSGS